MSDQRRVRLRHLTIAQAGVLALSLAAQKAEASASADVGGRTGVSADPGGTETKPLANKEDR